MSTDAQILPRPEPPISNARLAMLLFVASEAMLFTGLIAGYIILGFGSHSFSGMRALPLGLAPLGVAVLVASSAALVIAGRAAAQLDRAGRSDGHAARWALAALTLGVVFLCIQAHEWSSLLAIGMRPGSAVNAGMLYVVGGVHGLHVVVGLVLLALLALRSHRAPAAPATRTTATIAALYWHFVTIVWITLFLMLYIL